MCDETYALSSYQWIFRSPDSVKSTFGYYNTLILGGAWQEFFRDWGYYGFRVFSAILVTLTVLGVYLFLKDFFNIGEIILGIVIASIGCCRILVVHNYIVSMFFTVFALLTIYYAYKWSSWFLYFISGFLIGVNIFTRLPNFVFIALPTVLLLMRFIIKQEFNTVRYFFIMITGIVIGTLFLWQLSVILNHNTYLIEAYHNMFSLSSDSGNSHNISNLAFVYLNDYLKELINLVVVCFFPFSSYILVRKMKNPYINIFLFALFLVLLPLIFKYFDALYAIYGLATLLIVDILFSKNHECSYSKNLKFASLLIVYAAYLTPLGSDFGLVNNGVNCLLLLSPFVVGICRKKIDSFNSNKKILFSFYCYSLFLGIIVIGFGIKSISNHCFSDPGNRQDKCYMISNSLATTYTTQKNAQQVDQLLSKLEEYVKPGDELLCSHSLSGIHYLSQTRPYFGNPWLFTYSSKQLVDVIQKKEKLHCKAPVTVVQKSVYLWSDFDKNWNNANLQSNMTYSEKFKIVDSFLKRNGYYVIWENDVFQLLVTTKTFL